VTTGALITVDDAALAHNVATLRSLVGDTALMVVVKAGAYGHGAVGSALAFERAGVDRLGVADLDEAVALRRAGVTVPLLAWLHAPGETFERAVEHDVTPAVSDLAQLEAAAAAGCPTVHLCVDTGLHRNGAVEPEWAALFARAAQLSDRTVVEGLMSHLANTSEAEDAAQAASFERATEAARAAGLDPRLRHLSASAAVLDRPALRYDMVRVGLAAYGLSPVAGRSSAELGLRPALTLTAPVTTVKRVRAGEGVSYGYVFRPEADTTVVIVPLGYADGLDRAASDRAAVTIAGRRHRVRGRIAMNALVVDVGDAPVSVGDEVVLLGDPAAGHVGAEEWAEAQGGITYEVVTCLSHRIERTHA